MREERIWTARELGFESDNENLKFILVSKTLV